MKKVLGMIVFLLVFSVCVMGESEALKKAMLNQAKDLYSEGVTAFKAEDYETAVLNFKYTLTKLNYVGKEYDEELFTNTEKYIADSVKMLIDKATVSFNSGNYTEAYNAYLFLIKKEMVTSVQKEKIKVNLIQIARNGIDGDTSVKRAAAMKSSKMILDEFRDSAEREEVNQLLGEYYYKKANAYYKSGNYSQFSSLYREFCEMKGLAFNSDKAEEFKNGIIIYFENEKAAATEVVNRADMKEREGREHELKKKELDVYKEAAKNIKTVNFWDHIYYGR